MPTRLTVERRDTGPGSLSIETSFKEATDDDVPEEVKHLCVFLDNTVGSCLAAWLHHFDKDHDQRIRQGEFMYILQALGYDPERAKAVFCILDSDRSGELAFEEIHHQQAVMWQQFRAWCASTFQSVDDMLWRLGGNKALKGNQLYSAEFCEGLKSLGWTGGCEELLFNALDVRGSDDDPLEIGFLRAEELSWLKLELSRYRRKQKAKKAIAERAARRPGNQGRTHPLAHDKKAAMEKFQQFLKRQYGGFFRAWRLVLCPPGMTSLHKRRFFGSCAEVGWTKDIRVLWKAFGKSDTSYIVVDELDLATASIMARFREFVHVEFGSGVECFHAMDEHNRQKIRRSAFAELVADDKELSANMKLIFNEMQHVEGKSTKFVTEEDFAFLDRWQPLGFLLSKPNHQAAETVKALLLKHSKNYVKAWRLVIDIDSSNHCTWDEFENACVTIGFHGDVGGAWRALDADLSGCISLHEIDPISSEILVDFRKWADEEFGSVRSAFGVFDNDHSGALSLKEWRRNCRIYGYDGCARLLFHCLDVDNSDSLTLKEIGFLDGWHVSPEGLLAVSGDLDQTCQLTPSELKLPRLPAPILRELERVAIVAMDILQKGHRKPAIRKAPKTKSKTAEEIMLPFIAERSHDQHSPRHSHGHHIGHGSFTPRGGSIIEDKAYRANVHMRGHHHKKQMSNDMIMNLKAAFKQSTACPVDTIVDNELD